MSSTPGSGASCGWHLEQTDGAADIGHRLTSQPLCLFQRLDRFVDLAILL